MLDAPNELERSIGTTLVHLTWLELCGQVQLARVLANPDSPEAILESPEPMIDRHLRLAKVKCQTLAFLARLRAITALPAVHCPLPTFPPSPPSVHCPLPTFHSSNAPKLEKRQVADQLDHPALD